MTAAGVARVDRVLAVLLAACALAFSAWYSHAAPCGIWVNRVFDSPAWGEADPGAWYVFAAHQLGSDAAPIYHGHPGTPLRLLLSGVQHAYAAIAAPEGFTRGRFLAGHLPQLFWLSKLLMTGLHLLSFWALFALARALLRDRHAAFLATLGYASCFPVLYYLSRISPEPLAIACFAGAFLAFWRYETLAALERDGTACALFAVAGVLAMSGAVAKLQLLGPLPVLLAAMALTDFPRRLGGSVLPRRIRLQALALFGAASAATLAFYSQWIDWSKFLAYWAGLPSVRAAAGGFGLPNLIPGLSASNLLPAAELCFGLLAMAGFAMLLRRRPNLRPRALALGAFAGFGVLVFGYRVALDHSFLPFHYAFLALAAAAPFFGFALAALERRFLPARGPLGAASFALLAMLALHGLGIVAVTGSRQHDARVFAPNRAGYELIAQLAANEVLLVEDLTNPGRSVAPAALRRRLASLQGWPAGGILGMGGTPSELGRAFESQFIALPTGSPARKLPRVTVPLMRAKLVRVQ